MTVSIPAGTVCALVGPSGAGKSTFANLVPRFYEATEGRVLVPRLTEWMSAICEVADLRNNIAVVLAGSGFVQRPDLQQPAARPRQRHRGRKWRRRRAMPTAA